jgi:hypothetical protein
MRLALSLGDPSREKSADGEPTLVAEPVTTGSYVVAGGGGHTLLRFTARGLILVNGKRPGLTGHSCVRCAGFQDSILPLRARRYRP